MATDNKETKKTTAPKTPKTPKPKAEKEVKTEPVVDIEKEEMKKQMAEMKAQMELMAKMMAQVKAPESAPKAPAKKDRNIRFVNLTNGTIMLKGSKMWEIDGRFAYRDFLEREARIIVNNMANMIASGMVYIADAQFVEENDLGEIYMNILSDEDLKNLLQQDANYIVEAFKSVADGQKKVIVDMIRDAQADGVEVDANVLKKVGTLSGLDLLSDD